MNITYQSTRGRAPELDLQSVTMAGLASDGGLYVPKTWPEFTPELIAGFAGKSYLEVAQAVLAPFIGAILPPPKLKEILQKAYSGFTDPQITPFRQLDDRRWVLELFHGPTLAFKDVALQLLGHVFEHFLALRKQRMTVLGATSGDTGSAAIAALAGRKDIDVFILYPNKGPSEIQRKQMTCVQAANVHAVAIDGNFDDCQALVKAMFNDQACRAKYNLAAVNSINWMRILAQMVYYFYAAANIGQGRPVSFVVPTGNFGNVYAAYAAHQSGLIVSKLAVASNRNDILTRFFSSGVMQPETMHTTLSPSMDIQISSNFERLLFDLCQRNGQAVSELMSQPTFTVKPVQLAMARQLFTAARADDAATMATIKSVYAETGYILDPHSAAGVAAAKMLEKELPDPVISLACAHPAKFPDTIKQALGIDVPLPDHVAQLIGQAERTTLLPADITKVEKFISERVTL